MSAEPSISLAPHPGLSDAGAPIPQSRPHDAVVVQDEADVLAGLGVPRPSELEGKDRASELGKTPGASSSDVAGLMRSRSWWLVHAVLSIAFWCVSGLLCGVMAYWYFLHGFDWATVCCGRMGEDGEIGKPLFEWPLLGRLSGIPMWQIGAVVLAVAALLKILIERVKPQWQDDSES